MMDAGASGDVVLSFLVTKEGKPQDIRVLSAPDVSFAEAARDAVSKEAFTPATSHGQAVDCRAHSTMRFMLH
jgi:TonB family protein